MMLGCTTPHGGVPAYRSKLGNRGFNTLDSRASLLDICVLRLRLLHQEQLLIPWGVQRKEVGSR